jgi:hypothetical protein
MFRNQEKLMKLVLMSLIFICSSVIPSPAFAQRERGITEITFEEKSNWQGSMGKYVLNKDQCATMIAPNLRSETPRTLVFHGKFYDFDRLAITMDRQGFFKLRRRYSADNIYDANTVTISMVRNGIRRTVVDYGSAGPLNLWAVKQLLRGVTRQITWEESTSDACSHSPSRRQSSQFIHLGKSPANRGVRDYKSAVDHLNQKLRS